MCPKAFARAHQLAVHAPVHTGEKAHLCSECGNSFSSVSSLIDHRKRRHLDIRNKKCETCPKAFFTKQELEAHIRTHTGEKPFSCPVSPLSKGQLISKCPFDVLVLTKIPTISALVSKKRLDQKNNVTVYD